MTLSDLIYDSLNASFTPKLPAGTSAAVIAAIQDNWRDLADAFALASAGAGGLVAAPGMADGYVCFYTGTTTAAGDNDLTFDRLKSHLKLNGAIQLRDLASMDYTPASGFGFLYVKNDLPYYMDDAGTEHALIEATDITGLIQTVQEHYQQRLDAQHALQIAADGYGTHVASIANPHSVTATQVGKDVAQWNAEKIHSRVMDFAAPQDGQAFVWNADRQVWEPAYYALTDITDGTGILDGYVPEDTFQENKRFWNDALIHVKDACDAYGIGATELEHYTQMGAHIQTILKDLDGYEARIAQNKEAHSTDINTILKDLDGYQVQINGLAETVSEHATETGEHIQTIRKDLDGYNVTITEHYDQHSDAFDTVRKDLDGYNQTISEHYEQHSDALDDIRKNLDGYAYMAAVESDLIPDTDNKWSLGNSEKRWQALHVSGEDETGAGHSGIYLQARPVLPIINTTCGDNTYATPATGLGGHSQSARLGNPYGIARDSNGNIYFADEVNHFIGKIDISTFTVSVYAGQNGSSGSSGDGGAATSALLSSPRGIAFDSNNHLYIADAGNSKIRKVNWSTGNISTFISAAGNTNGITIDSADVMFFSIPFRVYRHVIGVGPTTVYAGTGVFGYDGHGGAATSAKLAGPSWLTTWNDTLYIGDYYGVRRVNRDTNIIDVVAGPTTMTLGRAGDGDDALNALFTDCQAVAFDSSGNLFIGDSNLIRRVDVDTNIITTYGGSGEFGHDGDDGHATSALTTDVHGIMFEPDDTLYFTDSSSAATPVGLAGNAIRRIEPLASDAGPASYRMHIEEDDSSVFGTFRLDGYGDNPVLTITNPDGYVGIHVIQPNEALTIDGAISLYNQIGDPLDNNDGYGKIYLKDDDLYFKDDTGEVSQFTFAQQGSQFTFAQQGSDGYVAFFTGSDVVAGDGDFYWDRENNRLAIRAGRHLGQTEHALHIGGDEPMIFLKAKQAVNHSTWIRFADSAGNISNFRGGFIEYDSTGDGTFNLGVHDAQSSDTADDVVSITMARDTGNVSIGATPRATKLTVDGIIALNERGSALAPINGFGQIRVGTDGKLYFLNESGSEITFANEQTVDEHYTQHSTAFDTVRKDLDGYGAAIHNILKDLDGYGQTEQEHHEQTSDAIHSILKDLDGYAQTEQEHHDQSSEAIHQIREALEDGYADVQQGADGYIAFFTGDTSLAGDNDFRYERDTATVTVNGTVDVTGTVETTALKMPTGADLDYVLTSDNDGNASWQEPTALSVDFDRIVTVVNDAGDGLNIVFDTLEDGNVVSY